MKNSKLTGRLKRMEHLEGLHKRKGLNLVSLMDIFTILVFFLLVSSGTQQLPNSKDMKLPLSVADKTPKETLVIAITKEDILVQGKKVAAISQVLESNDAVIIALEEELKFRSSNSLLAQTDNSAGRAVTIMGDENISYQLLRKILATCRQANYTRIAFAAFQAAKSKG
ncbi:ExbD/TolR family protein [Aliikangiella coralliicola]|uniref:Biopolymer transporter ExbD n=1 Tax=Aliikangiella coralliicola TaxID=2592383 RepID=A0A545U8T5_9GAMM|nr:biopolymer transporter ExbD [Aliikangiella coralliicola]TQV85879.1 biopolymer transporter ExbD [Aliikangiella coralliicola]